MSADLGEAYGDANVPADPYETVTDSLAEPEIEDNPDPEFFDPFGGFEPRDAAMIAAMDFLQDIAPGVAGLGAHAIRLRDIIFAWYEAGRDGAE